MEHNSPNGGRADSPLGLHKVQLDSKGRLKLPARFRQHLLRQYPNERLFVTSLDGRVGRVYPLSVWEANLELLDGFKEAPRRAQRIAIVANDLGADGEMDGQGRILIPPKLRQKLEVDANSGNDDKSVWLLWIRNGIDIYTKTVYEGLTAEAYEDAEENADFMRERGLL